MRGSSTLGFDQSADRLSLRAKLAMHDDLTRRLTDLERDMDRELQDWGWLPVVASLRALRGVDQLTAVSLLVEIGDMRRFPAAPQFMAYLGLTPSEYSSGGKRRTGAITKTGNGAVRRLLTESAWTYRHPARETKHLQAKAAGASDDARARAWDAQKRLCGRYQALLKRDKQVKTVVTAIAARTRRLHLGHRVSRNAGRTGRRAAIIRSILHRHHRGSMMHV